MVDELTDNSDFLQERFGFPPSVKVDTSKIVLAGHSFGATTVILSCMNDERVSACLMTAPWMSPLEEHLPASKVIAVTQPTLMIRCFNSKESELTIKKLNQVEATDSN